MNEPEINQEDIRENEDIPEAEAASSPGTEETTAKAANPDPIFNMDTEADSDEESSLEVSVSTVDAETGTTPEEPHESVGDETESVPAECEAKPEESQPDSNDGTARDFAEISPDGDETNQDEAVSPAGGTSEEEAVEAWAEDKPETSDTLQDISGSAESAETPADDSNTDDDAELDEDGEDSDDTATDNTFPVESILEALLIAAPEPRTGKFLARAVGRGTKIKLVLESIEKLNVQYRESGRAFEIVKIGDKFQIMSLPEYASFIGGVVEKAPSVKKLSPTQLDTLAIVAYKQPIMRVDIETIRGVACGQVLRALIEMGLVKVAGRNMEVVGQPMLYGTTERFLEVFGVSAIEDLPNIAGLRGD